MTASRPPACDDPHCDWDCACHDTGMPAALAVVSVGIGGLCGVVAALAWFWGQ